MPIKLNLVINRGQFNQANTQYVNIRTNQIPTPQPKALLAKATPPADRMSLKQSMGPNLGCRSCGG